MISASTGLEDGGVEPCLLLYPCICISHKPCWRLTYGATKSLRSIGVFSADMRLRSHMVEGRILSKEKDLQEDLDELECLGGIYILYSSKE